MQIQRLKQFGCQSSGLFASTNVPVTSSDSLLGPTMALKEQTTLWHPLTYFLLFPSTWKLDFVQGHHASLSSQLIYPHTTHSHSIAQMCRGVGRNVTAITNPVVFVCGTTAATQLTFHLKAHTHSHTIIFTHKHTSRAHIKNVLCGTEGIMLSQLTKNNHVARFFGANFSFPFSLFLIFQKDNIV